MASACVVWIIGMGWYQCLLRMLRSGLKISGREHRPQNIHETQLMPTVQTDLLADDQNRKGTFPEDYPKMPSVKNTIEVQSNKEGFIKVKFPPNIMVLNNG